MLKIISRIWNAGWGVKLVCLLCLVCVTLAALQVVSCIPSPELKITKEPRAGRPLESRVAIVYSYRYYINLLGLEKLHPHPQKQGLIYRRLYDKGYIKPEDVFVPKDATHEQLARVHNEEFFRSLKDSRKVAGYLEAHNIPVMPAPIVELAVLRPFKRQVGGTILAGELALKYGIGINIGGGYHHAYADHGEGFCIYNDLAVAIRELQATGKIRRALVVDLDVHQGNGTAAIFTGDDSVFTFSMHEDDIYPFPKAVSDLDIELRAGADDKTYLKLLATALSGVFYKAKPDIVFIQAGADVLAGDPLANLEMTPKGLVQRDAMVIDECVKRGIPVVMTLGGGYAQDSWQAQCDSIIRTIKIYGTQKPKKQNSRPTISTGLE